MSYTLQIKFETMEELSEFVIEKKIKESIKKPRKENDKRGQNVYILH